MTIQVIGPDQSSFDFPDGTPAETIHEALSKHYGAAPEGAAQSERPGGFDRNDPALQNQFARSMLRGIPIAGAYANKAAAGLRTAFNGGTFPENLRQEDAAERAYEEEHPVKNFAAQALGGTAALGGVGGAVPGAARALGMTGRLLPAMRNAMLSGGAISAADAAARGQPIGPAALTGAITGPASVLVGKGIGAGYDAAGRLIRGEPPVQTRFETVNGRQVPVRESVQTLNPDTSRTEQSMIASGVPAATEGEQATAEAMQAARGDVSHQLGSVAGGPPQQGSASSLEAGEAVANDLMQREQARAAAEVQRGIQAAEGTRNISSSMDQVPFAPAPEQPQQVGNMLSQRIRGLFEQAREATRAAYNRFGQTSGEYNPERLRGAGEDIRMNLNSGPDRVRISPEVTPTAAVALRAIDDEIAGLQFTNNALPGQRAAAAPQAQSPAADAAAIRAQYGDAVANKYLQQQQAKTNPGAQSLLEFLAAKGGLGPDAELDAIGAHGHTVNVDGVGRRKLVRQGGWPLDYAREAAEEAGYLPSGSTPADLLDTIDAEMRGQKRYPAGFEGTQTRREASAASEREQHEFERHRQGLEDDLAAAGHGELGRDVKERAVRLMREEGLPPDDAVERALMELEQEDAAGAGPPRGGFPGDRAAAPAVPSSKRPITAADMEQVRKQLVILRRQANTAARTTGNWEDARAVGRVMEGFDDWLRRVAQRPGGFSGDPRELLANLTAARAQHASERAMFSRRGPGDKVGTMMEQIIGKYPGQEMSPDKIIRTLLGTPSNPVGSEQAVHVLDHLRKGLGEASPEWAGIRKAVINMLTQAGPGEAPLSFRQQGENVQRFLGNERQAGAIFDQGQRARLAAHANHLLAAEDVAPRSGSIADQIDRLSGRVTGEGASPEKIVRAIKGNSDLAEAVMQQVTPRSRALIKQALWRDASEGLENGKPWGYQKTQTEIAKLLASPVAQAVYTPNERMLMSELARAHGRMIPIQGTVNTSGTAHMQQKLMGNVSRQLLRLFGLAHGGLHGLAAAEGAGRGVEWIGNQLQNAKAQTLFKGPQPARSPSRVAQIAQAQIARQGPLLATGRGDDQ